MIEYPSLTEKAIGMIEKENKIIFIVSNRATKVDVKQQIEELYGVKVEQVNMMTSMKGKKKAYVRLAAPHKAVDLATKLKII